MALAALQSLMGKESYEVVRRAEAWCSGLLERTTTILDSCLATTGIDRERVAFIAVGSVGRQEALDASDLDLVPVVKDPQQLDVYAPHDQAIRKQLQAELGIKVSRGQDLTKAVDLETLVAPETIGGDQDNSSSLTRRILILSEGQQAGGRLPVQSIRAAVLNAYAGAERTRGRHVLSLCNDLARYYRTLCIEYKAKIDIEDKDWATRNMKLRHSRKLWYLSSMLAIAALAKDHPRGEHDYVANLLEAFASPPMLRLAKAAGDANARLLAPILDSFAWFLKVMAAPEKRESLAKVPHLQRYEAPLFREMKDNSDRMHQGMITLIDALESGIRRRLLDWFLL